MKKKFNLTKNNPYFMLFLGGLVVFIIMLLVINYSSSLGKTTLNDSDKNNSNINAGSPVVPSDTPKNPPEVNSTPLPTNAPSIPENDKPVQSPAPIIPDVTYKEEDVVTYFKNQESLLTTYQNKEIQGSVLDSLKNGFVSVVDFVFYGGEIKGFTFKELTTSTKIQVLKVMASIDHKIDQYFPGYKDSIKGTYQNLKNKIAVLYLETTAKLCDTVGSNVCNQAREDFNNMKKSFGYTFSIIKELAKNGTSAIREWYASIK